MKDTTLHFILGLCLGLVIGAATTSIIVRESASTKYEKLLAYHKETAKLRLATEVEFTAGLACAHGVIDTIRFINSWDNKEPNCKEVAESLSKVYK
jgi:hypothetical protein